MRFQSFARNINPRLSLRVTPPSFTFSVFSISWRSQKPRQFIMRACFPLHYLPSRILHQGSSSRKSGRTPACFMAPLGGGRWGGCFAAVSACSERRIQLNASPLPPPQCKLCMSREGKATALPGFVLSFLACLVVEEKASV